MDRGGTALSAIVVDASVIGPMILLDERPLPADVEAELIAQPLSAPAHWPVETGNMLLVARRRGRIDDQAWNRAFGRLQALRVMVAPPSDWPELRDALRIAADHRLTLYDAAYLGLALASSAKLASLDRRLIEAAHRAGIPVLTYQ